MTSHEIERALFLEVVQTIVADGLYINLDTGDSCGGWEFDKPGSQNSEAIMKATFTDDGYAHCDEWLVLVCDVDNGWVGEFDCVSSNNGYDLIVDFTSGLAKYVEPVYDKYKEVNCG